MSTLNAKSKEKTVAASQPINLQRLAPSVWPINRTRFCSSSKVFRSVALQEYTEEETGNNLIAGGMKSIKCTRPGDQKPSILHRYCISCIDSSQFWPAWVIMVQNVAKTVTSTTSWISYLRQCSSTSSKWSYIDEGTPWSRKTKKPSHIWPAAAHDAHLKAVSAQTAVLVTSVLAWSSVLVSVTAVSIADAFPRRKLEEVRQATRCENPPVETVFVAEGMCVLLTERKGIYRSGSLILVLIISLSCNLRGSVSNFVEFFNSKLKPLQAYFEVILLVSKFFAKKLIGSKRNKYIPMHQKVVLMKPNRQLSSTRSTFGLDISP